MRTFQGLLLLRRLDWEMLLDLAKAAAVVLLCYLAAGSAVGLVAAILVGYFIHMQNQTLRYHINLAWSLNELIKIVDAQVTEDQQLHGYIDSLREELHDVIKRT